MPLIKCSKILSPHTSIKSFFKKTKDGKSFGIEVAASPFPQHKLSKLCMRPEAWASTQDYWSVVKKARDYKQSRCPADVWRSAVFLFQTRGTLLCSCLTQFPRKGASPSDSINDRVSGWPDFIPTTAELKKMAVTSTDTHYRKKVNYLCHLYCFAVNYLCHVNYFAYIW